MHMFYWPGGSFLGWTGMVISMLFWLLLVGGVIYIIFRLVRQRNPEKNFDYFQNRGDTALDVLKRRYAAGDITREQFLSIREELKEK